MKQSSKKVLLVGNPSTEDVFVPNFARHLISQRPGYDVDIVYFYGTKELPVFYRELDISVFTPFKGEKAWFESLPKIRVFIRKWYAKRLLKGMGFYDVCHIHGVDPFLSLVAEELMTHCRNLIATVYGSEFYRSTPVLKRLQRRIYDRASAITLANTATFSEFNQFYQCNYQGKLANLRYGLAPLDYLNALSGVTAEQCKIQMGIDPDYLVVTCGSNGNRNQQHFEIIKSICNELSHVSRKILFLFPMTYNYTYEYRDYVIKTLRSSSLNYRVVTDFLSENEVAYIRKCTDIFINLQTTDQLSGAMQEHLYENNIVITGSWLPYQLLEDRGIALNKIDSVGEVGAVLTKIINRFECYKEQTGNARAIIGEMSSWQNCMNNWLKLYECV